MTLTAGDKGHGASVTSAGGRLLMSEPSTAHTTKRRRNPFLGRRANRPPNPIDYAHGQRAPAPSPPMHIRFVRGGGFGLLVAFGAGALEISIPRYCRLLWIISHRAPPRALSGLPAAWCFCWVLRTPPSCTGGAG